MSAQPLQLFDFPITIDPHTVIVTFFLLVVLYWVIYTIVAIYHWLSYSHRSAIIFPAIGVHLIVSFLLVGYAITGLL